MSTIGMEEADLIMEAYQRGYGDGKRDGFNEGYAAAGGWPVYDKNENKEENKMEFINLTPHTLNIHTDDETIDLVPSGEVARVEITNSPGDAVGGLPVAVASYGEIVGLPDPKESTIYIVSGMVEAQTSRADVYSPGELVRDGAGKPIGCKGLKQTAVRDIAKEIEDTINGFEADYCSYEARAANAFNKIKAIMGH